MQEGFRSFPSSPLLPNTSSSEGFFSKCGEVSSFPRDFPPAKSHSLHLYPRRESAPSLPSFPHYSISISSWALIIQRGRVALARTLLDGRKDGKRREEGAISRVGSESESEWATRRHRKRRRKGDRQGPKNGLRGNQETKRGGRQCDALLPAFGRWYCTKWGPLCTGR